MTETAPQAPPARSAAGRPAPATRAPRPGGPGPRRPARLLRRGTPYLFLLVPLVLLVGLTYLPVANMVWYSFTDWDGLDKTKTYVGLDNYVDVFTQPRNVQVFKVSLYYFVASFAQMGLALYFATVLSARLRFRSMWKGILFFPYLINGVAIGLIFLDFLRPDGGLDTTLRAVGLQSLIHQWTGDPAIVNYTLASVSVWRYLGLNFVMFLGAIQSIPADIYEAAEIDGAGRWAQFRWIILPSIRPIVSLSFILAISGSLSVFEIPFIMTNGGNGSETFVIRAVKLAFNLEKVGLASAMAVVLLLVVLLVSWVQRRLVPDEGVDIA
ncbi:carbohydrate ABC transporter permease [Kineosporia sp. R_H_3]|uniref:carbohydrate ABC transporter permease n=1 Tax=Kineosporia sp. R_H_3 TaxID=1961848 RepID=UPI000B4C001D|nr:sugar ABC transporter permease [Kineosporia sp. R_H_3]